MNLLLEASQRFPTVIFTIGLGVALIYWLFVLLGALDIDLLGGGDAAGASKGIGEAIGASKGMGDAIGASKGVHLGDGADGAHAGHGHDHGDLGDVDDGGVFDTLGLASVPITISFTVVVLLGWVISLLGMQYGGAATGDLGGWLPAIMFVVVLIVAIVVGGQLVRPMAPLFAFKEGKSNRDYVGHTCTITTGSVDDGFGQATVEDGGTVLVIPVRCDKPGALARGHKALIIDFDRSREAYVVEPTTDLGGATG